MDEVLECYIRMKDVQPIVDELNTIDTIKRTGRNESCVCGSGKKYKKCCMQDQYWVTQQKLLQKLVDEGMLRIPTDEELDKFENKAI